MKILSLLFILFLIQSCTYRKTKKDCVYECQERGAEYVGIIPDGIRMAGPVDTTHDVCQCR